MAKKKKIVRRPHVAQPKSSSKPLTKKQKIGLLVAAGVLALAIILFAVLYDDGSLDVKKGAIEGAQENWLIADVSSNANRHKYYKLGEVGALEGFVLNAEGSIKDPASTLSTDFPMKPSDENAEITSYYVSGVTTEAKEMAESVRSYYTQLAECGEVQTMNRQDGTPVYYFLSHFVPAQGQTDSPESQTAVAYLPAIKDTAVLISVNNTITETHPLLTDAQLTDWLARIAETVTLETK